MDVFSRGYKGLGAFTALEIADYATPGLGVSFLLFFFSRYTLLWFCTLSWTRRLRYQAYGTMDLGGMEKGAWHMRLKGVFGVYGWHMTATCVFFC